MKVTVEYEIEDEDYEAFLQHDLVLYEPTEIFGVIMDEYAPFILTGYKAERS